jgi:hypothetical protein
MLHAISFSNGHVTSYRNRWVKTQNWANHTGAEGTFIDTNPNVNIINHAGLTLALAEGGIPLVTNEQLETLGESKIHPSFAKGLTAHPKIDPQTGELMTFRADWNEHRGTAGESATAGYCRFIPAFRCEQDGHIEWARLANGQPAAMHLIAWLPKTWAAQLDGNGCVLRLIDGITAGFCQDGLFFTRDEAAAAAAAAAAS